MKRILATLFCLLWASIASAQIVGDGMGSPYGVMKAAATYSGPGNVVSGATAWYGLRGYSAAYASPGTNKSVNLRRASDNATCDFVIGSTGNLGGTAAACAQGSGLSLAAFATTDATASCTAASTTLTCTGASSTPHAGSTLTGVGLTQPAYLVSCGTFTAGAGTCTLNVAQTVSVAETVTMTYGLFITEAYDQSGSGFPVIQATAGSQPQLLPLCLNSGTLTCMSFLSASTQNLSVTGPTHANPFSFSTAYYPLSGTNKDAVSNAGVNASNNFFLGVNTCPNFFYGSNNSSTVAWTNGCTSLHSVDFAFNGTSSTAYVDGSTLSLSSFPNTNGLKNAMTLGESGNASAYFDGYVAEFGIWLLAFTGGNESSLCHNKFVYWGTNGSC